MEVWSYKHLVMFLFLGGLAYALIAETMFQHICDGFSIIVPRALAKAGDIKTHSSVPVCPSVCRSQKL